MSKRSEERDKFTSEGSKDKWGYWIAFIALIAWPIALVAQIISSFF